jgi:hypothetical protein
MQAHPGLDGIRIAEAVALSLTGEPSDDLHARRLD